MNSDFRDLLAAFIAHGVEYLVVGAHALAAHGLVRATKDLDIWVRPEPGNAERTIAALAEFGAPLHDLTAEDLSHPGLIFQIDVEPIRVDVVTSVEGIKFEGAWRNRLEATFADQNVAVLSRRDLIANKRAAARDQDLLDIKWLESHGRDSD